MGRTRGAGARGEGDLKPCAGERQADGPRAGQGCGGSTTFVRTRHPWGLGIDRFRLGIAVSGRLWQRRR